MREGLQSAERANGREKNRWLKGRITSGILVFAFHLDQSRFPDFPSFRRREPPLELDVHCTNRETRLPLPPHSAPDFVTSHIKSRSTL